MIEREREREKKRRALKLVKFRNGIWSVNLLTYCEKEEHGVREKRKKIERKIRRSKGSKF